SPRASSPGPSASGSSSPEQSGSARSPPDPPDNSPHRQDPRQMSEHTPTGAQPEPKGSEPVRLDQGHVQGTGGVPEQFTNPGLPPHVLRNADLDEKAAKRAELQVALLFLVSIFGTVLFIVAYLLVDTCTQVWVPITGDMR